jgi:AcrR family transcriptional regulator
MRPSRFRRSTGSLPEGRVRPDSAPKPYHHGDLRAALIEAALQILAEQGLPALSVRAVARRVGVSEAALYHHFAGKSALVEAVVVDTLHQLRDTLREAMRTTPGTPLDRLKATGVAYVRFAGEQRARFQILYRPELRALSHPASRADGVEPSAIDRAGLEAYRPLLDALVACQQAGILVPGDPLPLALTAWATVHGLAQLLVDGVVSVDILPVRGPHDAPALARLVVERLAEGLVIRDRDDPNASGSG